MSLFSELSPELSQRTPQEMMKWFADPSNLSGTPEEERGLLLDEVAVRIAESNGGEGIDYLFSNLHSADEAHIRAILLGLTFVDERLPVQKLCEIKSSVAGLIDDPRPFVVARAIDCLQFLGSTTTRREVLAKLNHPSPFVVGSVLRFMARHYPEEAIPILERSLESPEPRVRENAVDELDNLGCATALPRIRALLNDPDKNVRQAAETAVANLEENCEELRQAV